MDEWKTTRLGDVVELKRGYDLPATQRLAGDIPIISSSGPSGFHNEAKVCGPGVITGRYGTIGQVFYVEKDFWPLNTSLYVRDFKGNDPRFIYYFLKTLDWEQFNDKSGVPGINRNHAHECPVRVPPKTSRTAIAKILGALDDKIDLNRRMDETLEAMAREIYKDWFVNFGPVRANAEGHPPYLAPELWSLFPHVLDDDDKPMGWRTSTLNDLANLNPETWSARNAPISIIYVDLANTKWGTIESTIAYTWTEAPSRARRVLRPGDTIVGTVRPGNGSFALVSDEDLTGSTGFAVLRPKEQYYREYVYCAATSSDNIERLAHLADGAAYPAVRPDVVSATELVVANDEIIRAFSSLTAGLIDRMQHNKRENQFLAKTRDLLLPKLMSGEIRLHEAEKMVQEVA